MTEAFVAEGDLWLCWEPSGDTFSLRPENDDRLSSINLDDLVAEHFRPGREPKTGDRHIGNVRITIEGLP